MNGGKIVGILIILVIIASIGIVSYDAVSNTISPRNVSEVIFNEGQLNQTVLEENSTNTSLENVNVNINKKTGGVIILFADSPNIYNVTSEVGNSTTNVTNSQENSTLNVNIESESSDEVIVLSNKYNYNISGHIVAGGVAVNIANKSKVDNINMNLTSGGLTLDLKDGTLNNVSSHITAGGLNINGLPSGVTTIRSTIEIGGVNVQLNEPVAHIFSNVDVGGLNPGDYQTVSDNEFKGNNFDISPNKLVLYSNIDLGGVNTQNFQ